MSIRGQSPEAWRARFRKGTCPVHGTGFVDVDAADPAAGEQQDGAATYRVQRCVGRVGESCAILVARFAGKDEHHASFGWVEGPDDIRAALAHAGELAATGVRPGKWGKEVRVSHPLETT